MTDHPPATVSRPDAQTNDAVPPQAIRARLFPFTGPVPAERVIRGVCIGGVISLVLWALLVGIIMVIRRL
ncbi:conserved hypothetical protein [Gluconacetobacter diazotrophicus PA1 5]|uniref:Uncharacterized protein n=2 Tax=Gluconacetobacter diazotrophicus TaxID=33996 RepID=A9H8Y2_GLUDA|nr:hypothetical protein [Gluconacetobacter diazotrophicus]ACI51141.1 conserved hypothetical protein [Gluconacetobacter diazotrophicus PA1 5]MBB2155145.1 hypothetical protein [Gluconacetobacter diazotrophicus]TWB07582.1 hypothetical protein FBZ86_11128 [Gluconacetobacter diazotrophicus]CAP54589.1 hypothetical protein GDI0646 [Gluconacetobacter diazotrophicus PA1 5]